MIPPDKTLALSRALLEAFGTTALEDMSPMTQGLSSDLAFRIVVQGSPFLLRIMTRIDERNDPVRLFTCMKTAAEAGLAPRVWYADTQDGISIIDLVKTVPFPSTLALLKIPATLRTLHALPLFPKSFNYVTAHKFFIWKFRASSLLPKTEIEEVFVRYDQLCAAYPRLDSEMVSSHMDLKPENILFDGQRVWLTGWQAAFVNDRYFDLAVAANFLVTSDQDELTYLNEYFCRPPDEYERARFFLMRQVLHMFYATVFLLLGSEGKPINQAESLPSFRDFHRRIWEGEINLADNNAKVLYGTLHWKQLLQNIRQPRFREALGIVTERNARGESPRLLPRAA